MDNITKLFILLYLRDAVASDDHQAPYMCNLLKIRLGVSMSEIPELLEQKPLRTSGPAWFYWGNIKSRIKCINNAIKLVENGFE